MIDVRVGSDNGLCDADDDRVWIKCKSAND